MWGIVDDIQCVQGLWILLSYQNHKSMGSTWHLWQSNLPCIYLSINKLQWLGIWHTSLYTYQMAPCKIPQHISFNIRPIMKLAIEIRVVQEVANDHIGIMVPHLILVVLQGGWAFINITFIGASVTLPWGISNICSINYLVDMFNTLKWTNVVMFYIVQSPDIHTNYGFWICPLCAGNSTWLQAWLLSVWPPKWCTLAKQSSQQYIIYPLCTPPVIGSSNLLYHCLVTTLVQTICTDHTTPFLHKRLSGTVRLPSN